MGRLCASYHLKDGILNFEIKTCAAFYSFMKWHLIVAIHKKSGTNSGDDASTLHKTQCCYHYHCYYYYVAV